MSVECCQEEKQQLPFAVCHTTRHAVRASALTMTEQDGGGSSFALLNIKPNMAASTSRTPTFRPDKSLLNPHFEAYKLDVSEYNSKVYRLPSPASYQSDVLGFQELKDRHNQPKLVPGSIPGQLAYIDNAGFVVLIVINKVRQMEA